jgi:DNA polymerase-3 subunit gamma/tau
VQAVRPRAREPQTTPERGASSRDPRDEPRAPSGSDDTATPPATRDAAAELEDFRKIVDRVRDERPELAAFLEHAAPLEVNATQILLGWEKGSIFAEQASTKESILLLTRAASEHFRATPRVTFDLDSARAKTTTTVAAIDAEAREEQARQAVAQARRHPRVADAIEILGARLKDVKLGD